MEWGNVGGEFLMSREWGNRFLYIGILNVGVCALPCRYDALVAYFKMYYVRWWMVSV